MLNHIEELKERVYEYEKRLPEYENSTVQLS